MKWTYYIPVYAVVWLFVKGIDLTLMDIAAGLIEGALVGLPVAYLFKNFHSGELRPFRTRYTLIYIVDFVKELLFSNLDVAYRVLAPSMPINPEVVEVNLNIQNKTAITVLANSITLTPGTLTVDYFEESNSLLIHCLNYEGRKELESGIRKWEKLLSEIFEGGTR